MPAMINRFDVNIIFVLLGFVSAITDGHGVSTGWGPGAQPSLPVLFFL